MQQKVLLLAVTLLFWGMGCTPPPKKNTCQQDADCPSGQICKQSQCKTPETACKVDEECTGGKVCIRERCQEPICRKDLDCSDGERCEGGRCLSSEALAEKTREDGGRDRGPERPPTEPSGDRPLPDNPPDLTPDQPTEHRPDPPPSEPRICSPNRDGVIQRSEMLFALGTSVIYSEAGSSNSSVTVDMKGTVGSDGVRLWDLSTPYPDAKRVIDELLSPAGTWFEKDFPQATYVAVLDRTLDALGVYRATPEALLMLGWVSRKASSIKIKYDKPPALIRFPLKVGDKWTSSATGSGTFNMAMYRASETYDFEVVDRGKVKTLAGTYPVLRLRLKFTQQQYLPTIWRTTRYSYFFVSECLGFVAIVDSKKYEADPFFTKASRVKRLSD